MFKRIRTIAISAVVALTPVGMWMFSGTALAATKTWTGGGVDGNWSTTANWQGGVAPVNGDSIVIDNSATFTNGSTDDIAALSLNTITFTNNAASSPVAIFLGQNLTVTTAITQAVSDTTTEDQIADDGSARTITIGGTVTVTASPGGLSIGSSGDTLAIGSNSLTFTDQGGNTADITAIDANMTGTGAAVVYNGAATDYQLSGANTYTGTTHVIATDLPIDNTNNNNAFGTSAITVETGGSVTFTFNSNTTISNAITVSGTTNGSPVVSLGFGTATPSTTFTVPNITLNGSTRFSNQAATPGNLTVNLAGITANGNCIEYIGPASADNGPANGFTNGPAGCIVSGTIGKTPGTPNTGFMLVKNNAVASGAVIIAAAAGVALIARRSKRATQR